MRDPATAHQHLPVLGAAVQRGDHLAGVQQFVGVEGALHGQHLFALKHDDGRRLVAAEVKRVFDHPISFRDPTISLGTHVFTVVILAQVQFMFVVCIARHCFEYTQELLHVFDKGLRKCRLYLRLLMLFAAVPVHSAQSSNKKYYPYPI